MHKLKLAHSGSNILMASDDSYEIPIYHQPVKGRKTLFKSTILRPCPKCEGKEPQVRDCPRCKGRGKVKV